MTRFLVAFALAASKSSTYVRGMGGFTLDAPTWTACAPCVNFTKLSDMLDRLSGGIVYGHWYEIFQFNSCISVDKDFGTKGINLFDDAGWAASWWPSSTKQFDPT